MRVHRARLCAAATLLLLLPAIAEEATLGVVRPSVEELAIPLENITEPARASETETEAAPRMGGTPSLFAS